MNIIARWGKGAALAAMCLVVALISILLIQHANQRSTQQQGAGSTSTQSLEIVTPSATVCPIDGAKHTYGSPYLPATGNCTPAFSVATVETSFAQGLPPSHIFSQPNYRLTKIIFASVSDVQARFPVELNDVPANWQMCYVELTGTFVISGPQSDRKSVV